MSDGLRYPKRPIEVDLPIKRISAHARREKSSHHGHISTLHIWWARRPLAACRAEICAALWPNPAPGKGDEPCPAMFIEVARREMLAWTSHERQKLLGAESRPRFEAARQKPALFDEPIQLRGALLDFIADFANWDNSTVREYLDTSRALTQSAHVALGGAEGTRPLIVDPFAGGGSIPLEALRVGADAFASDLNPVPVLLNKILLEHIPRYGERLVHEVRDRAKWIKDQAEAELGQFYPKDIGGAMPIAYLWARTIRCEGPGCGCEVPLIRNMQVTRKGRKWYFGCREDDTGQIQISIREGGTATDRPTVSGGSVTCPRPSCNYSTPAQAVRFQLAQRQGGADDARLLAIYVDAPSGRYFRSPTALDLQGVRAAKESLDRSLLPQDEINATRPYANTRGLSAVTRVGVRRFGDLYTSRQGAAIRCFQNALFRLEEFKSEPEIRQPVMSVLQCAVSRFIFQNCSLSRWNAARSTIEGAFGKQALQVVWDFAESNPLSDGPANWDGAIEWVIKVIQQNSVLTHTGTVAHGKAQDQLLPTDAADALVTDPPYFAAIPYGDLSNVFFVWEREFFKRELPELFNSTLVNQDDEIVVTNANRDSLGNSKDSTYYRLEMVKALSAARAEVKPNGIGVIVFADSNTASWEAILGAVIESGWSITGSWPIDTELQSRTQATGSASLQSSIHLVCRPRETADGSLQTAAIGDWSEVLQELPKRLREWMPRLADEGVVGSDAIFACLGPALEVFSRFSSVERASGDTVTLREYLEHVWAAVAREALSTVLGDGDSGSLEPDARLAVIWLWTLGGGKEDKSDEASEDAGEDDGDVDTGTKKVAVGYVLEFDAARKIAQGLGAKLEELTHVVAVKGDKARLLPVSERATYLFGKVDAIPVGRKAKKRQQLGLFAEIEEAAEEQGWGEVGAPRAGTTTLDRVNQAMLLFASGRGEALKRFLVEDGVGKQAPFWKLAQALSALYPGSSDEKRWVDGVLARKKALGFG